MSETDRMNDSTDDPKTQSHRPGGSQKSAEVLLNAAEVPLASAAPGATPTISTTRQTVLGSEGSSALQEDEIDPAEELLAEVIDEFTARVRRGESPSIAEYRERHPEIADEIDQILPSIAAMEKARRETHSQPTSNRPDAIPSQLGDFLLCDELGRGGMGIVFAAYQKSLQRLVAIKLLPRALLMDDRHRQRFEREARIAANLHHTNIVPVFGVGEDQGYRFYVMQLIDGMSLADILNVLRDDRSVEVEPEAEPAETGEHKAQADANTAAAKLAARVARGARRESPDAPTPDSSQLARSLASRLWRGVWSEGSTLRSDSTASSSSPESAARSLAPNEHSDERPRTQAFAAASSPPSSGQELTRDFDELAPWPFADAPPSASTEPSAKTTSRAEPTSHSRLFNSAARTRSRDDVKETQSEEPPALVSDASRSQREQGDSLETQSSDRLLSNPTRLKLSADVTISSKGLGETDDQAEVEPEADHRPSSRDSKAGDEGSDANRAEASGVKRTKRRAAPEGFYRQVAEIGRQAALALQYAHEHGLLHRDIKPGNLLLDREGRVWVADFGLARAFEQSDVSRTGEIVGTWRYMAPEQWSGKTTASCDLFGLGATLHELVTRQLFRNQLRGPDIQQMQRADDIVRPRAIDPAIPRDLETIILRCLAADPNRRYVSAGALADDLLRFLEGRPIQARRVGPIERLHKWVRRNPTAAALSLVVVALVTAVFALTIIGYDAQTRGRARAEETRRIALDAIDRVFRDLDLGSVALDTGALDEESELVGFHSQGSVTPETARILQQLVPIFDQLSELEGTDPTLALDSARAYSRIGDIELRLGNYDRSREAYQESLTRYRNADASTASVEVARAWARTSNQIGLLSLMQEEREQAQEEFEKTIAWCSQRASQRPAAVEDSWLIYEHARAYYLLGVTLRSEPIEGMRRPLEGRGFFGGLSRVSWERMGQVIDEFRDELRPGGGQAVGPAGFAPQPATNEALRPGRIGMLRQLIRQLQNQGPNGPLLDREGSNAAESQTGEIGDTAYFPEANELKRLRAVAQALFSEFRAPPGLPRELAEDLLASQVAFRSARDLLEPLVEQFPNERDFRFSLALALRDGLAPWRFRADSLRDVNQRTAIEILQQLVEEAPRVPDYRVELAETLSRVPPPDRFSGVSLAEYEADLRRALTLAEGLIEESRRVPRYQLIAVRVLEKLAMYEALANKNREMLSDLNRAYQLQASLADSQLATPEYSLYALRLGMQLADALGQQGDWVEAGALLEDCRERWERVEPTWREHPRYRELGAVIEWGLQSVTEAVLRGEAQQNQLQPPPPRRGPEEGRGGRRGGMGRGPNREFELDPQGTPPPGPPRVPREP